MPLKNFAVHFDCAGFEECARLEWGLFSTAVSCTHRLGLLLVAGKPRVLVVVVVVVVVVVMFLSGLVVDGAGGWFYFYVQISWHAQSFRTWW